MSSRAIPTTKQPWSFVLREKHRLVLLIIWPESIVKPRIRVCLVPGQSLHTGKTILEWTIRSYKVSIRRAVFPCIAWLDTNMAIAWGWADLYAFGIGFHHAGLSYNDRKAIESAFLQGHLNILCEYDCPVFCLFISHLLTSTLFPTPGSTSSLAVGVNLPAWVLQRQRGRVITSHLIIK